MNERTSQHARGLQTEVKYPVITPPPLVGEGVGG